VIEMLLVLAFVLFAAAVVVGAGALDRPAHERRASLRRAQGYVDADQPTPHVRGFAVLRTARAGRLAQLAHRVDPRATEERVGVALISAGLARRIAPVEYLALKVVLGVVGLLVGAAWGLSATDGARVALVTFGAAAAGFLLPDLYVRQRTRTRRRQLSRALPEALDLLAVSVEAGASFDGAVLSLSEHMDGPLVEELMLVLAELRVGESRANALRKLSDRLDVPEITSTVTGIIQAEALGSPLGQILRVQADETRHRRQIAAEEEAAKAPVKMLLPIGLFILPAMFIVIIGPAVIKIQETL
jgi:tight adherence protein C